MYRWLTSFTCGIGDFSLLVMEKEDNSWTWQVTDFRKQVRTVAHGTDINSRLCKEAALAWIKEHS
jgi:hypothetical protein